MLVLTFVFTYSCYCYNTFKYQEVCMRMWKLVTKFSETEKTIKTSIWICKLSNKKNVICKPPPIAYEFPSSYDINVVAYVFRHHLIYRWWCTFGTQFLLVHFLYTAKLSEFSFLLSLSPALQKKNDDLNKYIQDLVARVMETCPDVLAAMPKN